MAAVDGAILHRECGFLTGTVGLGLDPEGRAAKPAADQIVEDTPRGEQYPSDHPHAKDDQQRDCGCLAVESHVYDRSIENKSHKRDSSASEEHVGFMQISLLIDCLTCVLVCRVLRRAFQAACMHSKAG
jgi:hypothetical protein